MRVSLRPRAAFLMTSTRKRSCGFKRDRRRYVSDDIGEKKGKRKWGSTPNKRKGTGVVGGSAEMRGRKAIGTGNGVLLAFRWMWGGSIAL